MGHENPCGTTYIQEQDKWTNSMWFLWTVILHYWIDNKQQEKGIPNYKATSNCEYCHFFNLKSAATATKRCPCTNRPIESPLDGCKVIVWSYNVAQHINADHNGENSQKYLINNKEKEDIRYFQFFINQC